MTVLRSSCPSELSDKKFSCCKTISPILTFRGNILLLFISQLHKFDTQDISLVFYHHTFGKLSKTFWSWSLANRVTMTHWTFNLEGCEYCPGIRIGDISRIRSRYSRAGDASWFLETAKVKKNHPHSQLWSSRKFVHGSKVAYENNFWRNVFHVED